MQLASPILAGLALVASLAVTETFKPPSQAHCSNRFIDRPDCAGSPKACGPYVSNGELCPDRALSREERVHLASIPVDQRPPWDPNWNVEPY